MLATSTHGTRGRSLEPRASVRTIGVAITATRCTRSATSSLSSSTAIEPPPLGGRPARASGLRRMRSITESTSPATASRSRRSRSGPGSSSRVASVPSRSSGTFVVTSTASRGDRREGRAASRPARRTGTAPQAPSDRARARRAGVRGRRRRSRSRPVLQSRGSRSRPARAAEIRPALLRHGSNGTRPRADAISAVVTCGAARPERASFLCGRIVRPLRRARRPPPARRPGRMRARPCG